MLQEIIILFATAVAGSFGGWLFGRRQQKAQAHSAEIGNLDHIVKMWQETANSFKESYDEMRKKYTVIMTELEQMRQENHTLVCEVKKLRVLTEELKEENKGLVRRLNDIKKFQQKEQNDKA